MEFILLASGLALVSGGYSAAWTRYLRRHPFTWKENS